MIVAVLSRKGGVGKTTTAVNLAAALAEHGKRVLLVDLDPSGCASASLGVERGALAPSAADVCLGRSKPLDSVRETATPGLHLMTSSADLRDVEAQLVGGKRNQVAEALDPLTSVYDLIFIDAPPSFSPLAQAALFASDYHLIPATPNFLSRLLLPNTVDSMARACHRFGVRSHLLGILMNMSRSEDDRAPLRELFEERLFETSIEWNECIASAPEQGLPVLATEGGTGPASRAYRELAIEACGRLGLDAPGHAIEIAGDDDPSGTSWVSPLPASTH